MHMTAFARLEQFRIDIEKLLAEKAQTEARDDQADHCEVQGASAPDNPPGSTMQDAAGDVASSNFFKAVDDALAVLN
jgi:hypothetical protein